MLTKQMQLLLIRIYIKGAVSKKEAMEIYKNERSLYQALSYLKMNDLVFQHGGKDHVQIYYELTWKGLILSFVLSGFKHLPKEIKKMGWE